MTSHLAAAFAASLVFLAPSAAGAQPVSESSGPDTYLQLRIGGFIPIGVDLEDLDPGLDLGGTFGARFGPVLAAELGLGYLRLEGRAEATDLALWDVPVTASLRVRAPLKIAEVSVFGGAAVHFVSTSSHPDVGDVSEDDATAFGWHAGAEIAFHLSPMVRVGAEGAWSSARPRLEGGRIDLEGVRASITAAYHF